ncbi:Crp/Fnr family transcriptional regulator [Flammeovirga kamogawensis]|uniref:Crp/Fnr family transcriptional regulator n=1 Tax=Flammeovirga kamogawensis TaxID=373891 RepID=A0ABX8GYW7_9BACT|nr:Crp/Fnr family transcriptional regulator [Flammeovirga kamogawensis]MBB6463935.1 CRP-like cAMP-binding protein [Flammeovirga kamogawensis]QWG08302.1 Crp/Fnr family transcriptional regulator [Flammeovirga kamogawensis]TRX66598.1 Crp/Fnr family transcriptional regulator [Flammeovirga kamogawensis]
MENFRHHISQLIDISEIEWSSIKEVTVQEHFNTKETILDNGKIARNIYFIKKGLIRSFYLLNGQEINTYFACDNQFISSYASFIAQLPSLEQLETIEETEVLSISYEKLNALYKQHPKLEKLGRIIAEKNYLCVVDRTLSMQTKTAKEKYLEFIDKYDFKIINNVPQHQIATFLGIAPESLSRVRKQISTS